MIWVTANSNSKIVIPTSLVYDSCQINQLIALICENVSIQSPWIGFTWTFETIQIAECSQVALCHRKPIWKLNFSMHCWYFRKYVILILKYLTVCFMAYLRAAEKVIGLQKYKKYLLLRSSYLGETFYLFILAFLLIKLHCRANFLKIASIRVALPILALLPYTW